MGRKLNEQEIEEVKSLGHFIKYLLCKPNVKDYELWDGMLRLDAHGQKILSENIDKDSYTGLIDLDDMKELSCRVLEIIMKRLTEKDAK